GLDVGDHLHPFARVERFVSQAEHLAEPVHGGDRRAQLVADHADEGIAEKAGVPLGRVTRRELDGAGQRPDDRPDELDILLGEGARPGRVDLQEPDRPAAPGDGHGEPGPHREGGLLPGGPGPFGPDVADEDRLACLHGAPASAGPPPGPLAERFGRERTDRRTDDELVPLDRRDRPAGERHERAEAVERGVEDLVELSLAGRGGDDLEYELRRRQGTISGARPRVGAIGHSLHRTGPSRKGPGPWLALGSDRGLHGLATVAPCRGSSISIATRSPSCVGEPSMTRWLPPRVGRSSPRGSRARSRSPTASTTWR